MRYVGLATDGDGTLLKNNRMSGSVAVALDRFRGAGGRLFLVTGERVDQLSEFPRLDLFETVVAENGAMLFDPATRREVILCERPEAKLVEMLCGLGGCEVECGRVVITTKKDCKRHVEDVLAELKSDWQIVNNRTDLLVLPRGVDKASGIVALLHKTGLKSEQVVGIGDAENDVALIRACGLGVAVADSVPQLKARAQLITEGGAGQGIVELIERMLRDDLPRLNKAS